MRLCRGVFWIEKKKKKRGKGVASKALGVLSGPAVNRGERCKLASRPRCLRLWAEGGSYHSVATCDSNSFFFFKSSLTWPRSLFASRFDARRSISLSFTAFVIQIDAVLVPQTVVPAGGRRRRPHPSTDCSPPPYSVTVTGHIPGVMERQGPIV